MDSMIIQPPANIDPSQLFIDNAVIKPPEVDPKNLPTRKIRYAIDSRDRNHTLYPSPSKYTLDTEEMLKDIVQVDLTLADFPFNDYNITNKNNVLHTSLGDYEIPPGVYDPELLADKISTITPIQTTYDPVADKFSFTSTENMDLFFKHDKTIKYDNNSVMDVYPNRSVGKTLGFPIQNISLTENTPLEATYRVDLKDEDHIVMYLSPAKVISSKNNVVHNCFAIINKGDTNGYSTEVISSKRFNPCLPNFNRLSLKFCDREGRPYDFQNKDHRMELVFTCLKQTVGYNGIFGGK